MGIRILHKHTANQLNTIICISFLLYQRPHTFSIAKKILILTSNTHFIFTIKILNEIFEKQSSSPDAISNIN